VQEWIERVHQDMKKEFNSHAQQGDLEWLVQNGHIFEYQSRMIERFAKNLGVPVSHVLLGKVKMTSVQLPTAPRKDAAYKAVEREVKKVLHSKDGDYKGSSLSDIVEGATKGRVQAGWGHGKKYWSSHGVEIEAFAELAEATISSPEGFETIKAYLPKSVACFEEMMVDAAKLVERRKKFP
jgi:hypothetical protein